MNATIQASNDSGERDAEIFYSKVKAVTDQAFPNGEWPQALQPLPLVNISIADMFRLQGNYLEALRYGLRGSLLCRRSGSKWVHYFFDLVQRLARLVLQPNFKDNRFVTSKEIWDIYHGYLRELTITVNMVFGANTSWSKAVKRWWDEVLESAGTPRPGTAAFAKRFKAAQAKLLVWAEVTHGKGIELS
jgi:SET and MYND domain-containing protein